MKIRTDFVTNSSSSSFCTMIIECKHHEDIYFDIEDGFDIPYEEPTTKKSLMNRMSSVNNVHKLILFLKKCEVEDRSDFGIDEFYSEIEQLDSIEEVRSVSLEYAECFEGDIGGINGGSFKYDFETGKGEVGHKAPDWFVDDMIDIYGLDEDDED